MKKYITPEIVVLDLSVEGVICTSGVNPDSTFENFTTPVDFTW